MGTNNRLFSSDSSQKPGKRTALHNAVSVGHLGLASGLTEVGFDLNAMDSNKQTPVHLAAMGDNPAMMEILLKNGNANVMLKDDQYKSPVELAAQNPNLEF